MQTPFASWTALVRLSSLWFCRLHVMQSYCPFFSFLFLFSLFFSFLLLLLLPGIQKMADMAVTATEKRLPCVWVHRTLDFEGQPTDAQSAASSSWFDVDASLAVSAEPWGRMRQLIGELREKVGRVGGRLTDYCHGPKGPNASRPNAPLFSCRPRV